MSKDAEFWIDHLQLIPHPEGGFYRENYRAGMVVSKQCLPAEFKGERPVSTAIYFLLRENDFSAFHRIVSDEIWHFYAGDNLEIFEIEKDGNLMIHLLGNDPEHAAKLQVMIKRGNWFASRPAKEASYSLVGCTVAPGFHFDDFEMATRDELITGYPQHADIIAELTREVI